MEGEMKRGSRRARGTNVCEVRERKREEGLKEKQGGMKEAREGEMEKEGRRRDE